MAEEVRTGRSDNHIRRQDEDPERPLDAGRPLHEVGNYVSDCRLLSTLGKSGFGMVYLAEQEHPIERLPRRSTVD